MLFILKFRLRAFTFLILLIPGIMFAGCGGGGTTGLVVADIQGPDSINEQTNAVFTVDAEGDTGISYDWSVDKTEAASIADPHLKSVSVQAADVALDTTVKITVSVTSDNSTAVVRSKEITVLYVPDGTGNEVQITGPDSMSEYSTETFKIEIESRTISNVHWSTDPPDSGRLRDVDNVTVEFTAYGTSVESQVTIKASFERSANALEEIGFPVDILNGYDPAGFLGYGHPIEGVNYARNNRSPNAVSIPLPAGESVAPPWEPDEELHDILIDDNERIFMGSYMAVPGPWYSITWEGYYSWLFDFGGDFGGKQAGGFNGLCHENGYTTVGNQTSTDTVGGHGDYSGSSTTKQTLIDYSLGFASEASIEDSYGWIFVDGYYNTGDFETARRFLDVLTLPDERVITGFTRNTSGENSLAVQCLDQNLETLIEHNLNGEAKGTAFDEITGNIYIRAGAVLHCYDFDFEELWNTDGLLPDFSGGLPVIADNGTVLGCANSKLIGISPDGVLVGEVVCDAVYRPALMNDGAICVVSMSNVLFFDENLNKIDEFPLPTGPDSGTDFGGPPLIDNNDNLILIHGSELYFVDTSGNVLDLVTFESPIRKVRLGQNHLYVALQHEIWRF